MGLPSINSTNNNCQKSDLSVRNSNSQEILQALDRRDEFIDEGRDINDPRDALKKLSSKGFLGKAASITYQSMNAKQHFVQQAYKDIFEGKQVIHSDSEASIQKYLDKSEIMNLAMTEWDQLHTAESAALIVKGFVDSGQEAMALDFIKNEILDIRTPKETIQDFVAIITSGLSNFKHNEGLIEKLDASDPLIFRQLIFEMAYEKNSDVAMNFLDEKFFEKLLTDNKGGEYSVNLLKAINTMQPSQDVNIYLQSLGLEQLDLANFLSLKRLNMKAVAYTQLANNMLSLKPGFERLDNAVFASSGAAFDKTKAIDLFNSIEEKLDEVLALDFSVPFNNNYQEIINDIYRSGKEYINNIEEFKSALGEVSNLQISGIVDKDSTDMAIKFINDRELEYHQFMSSFDKLVDKVNEIEDNSSGSLNINEVQQSVNSIKEQLSPLKQMVESGLSVNIDSPLADYKFKLNMSILEVRSKFETLANNFEYGTKSNGITKNNTNPKIFNNLSDKTKEFLDIDFFPNYTR
ncbi:MAG: hypothetical protein HRT47_03390 [Candidatus Caenarcaniphilales bacterium]|nr:hypothetical protein [Candidatus Caenarcaniphilales bacterium]